MVESAEGGEPPRRADEPATRGSDASAPRGGGASSAGAASRDEEAARAGGAGTGDDDARPDGDVYDWYRRGLGLLESGNAAAAAQLLGHAAAAEPTSRSVREALARAQFDAGWYADARDNFARIIEENPADDYAQFGLGLSAARTGDLQRAVEHLALAVAMRPDLGHYGTALRGARAALSRR